MPALIAIAEYITSLSYLANILVCPVVRSILNKVDFLSTSYRPNPISEVTFKLLGAISNPPSPVSLSLVSLASANVPLFGGIIENRFPVATSKAYNFVVVTPARLLP